MAGALHVVPPLKRSRVRIDPMLRCVANRRHDLSDGATFQEKINGETLWVARLECARCGCQRVTLYEPHPDWVQIGSHRYVRKPEYLALLTRYTQQDADREILAAMWVST